jgi:Mg2+/Co2+ transporter CorB
MLLELLQEIPDAPISLKVDQCIIEVVQVHDQAIKVVKLRRPAPAKAVKASKRVGARNRAE